MLAAFQKAIRREREIGVPRRFSMGTIFVLLTLFALLFRLLVLCRVPVNVTGIVCFFSVAVTFGQMLFLRGARPRAASIFVGAITAPVMLAAIALDELTMRATGMTPIAGGLDRISSFLATCILLALLGMGLGYFVGGIVASVFYLLGKFVPQSGVAGVPLVGAEDTVAVDAWVEKYTDGFIKCFSLFQPKAPIRGAAVKIGYTLLSGLIVLPYVMWTPPSHVMTIAFGFGIAFAIWSGIEQLSFFWPLALIAAGCLLVGIVPYRELQELPLVKHAWTANAFVEMNDPIRTALCFIGGLFGLTVAGLTGWSQWALSTRHNKQPYGVKVLASLLLFLVCVSILSAAAIRHWVNSPTQQLYARILDQGGSPHWANAFAPTKLVGITLTEASGDKELLETRPYLKTPYWVQLRGPNFTDAVAESLEGIHANRLSIDGASLTDAAFSNTQDMSGVNVFLTNMSVGDKLVGDIARQTKIQAVMTSIHLSNTKVTDESLRLLSKCGKLSKIVVGQCDITDAGLASLSAFVPLRVLHLDECPITDEGMAALVKAAPLLQDLNINGTEITDVGLAHLSRLRSLRILRAQETAISEQGVNEFKQVLPSCSLSWDEDVNGNK